jgi:hypothetical protein
MEQTLISLRVHVSSPGGSSLWKRDGERTQQLTLLPSDPPIPLVQELRDQVVALMATAILAVVEQNGEMRDDDRSTIRQ